MTKKASLKDQLVEHAIDFLKAAIDEFQSRPKYSIINFYTAVELFLKARLLHEHWSLVVSKEPDKQKFEAGDFTSVTFDEACARLQKIVQSQIPDGARKNFDAIRKHRNKMVHFYHQANTSKPSKKMIEDIAREQLRAWHDLNQLLTTQWKDEFATYSKQIKSIEAKLKGHKEYLQAKFAGLETEISKLKSEGMRFKRCGSCGFKALGVSEIFGDLEEAKCLVCGHEDIWFDFTCPECGKKSHLYEGGVFVCEHCDNICEEDVVAQQINEDTSGHGGRDDALVPANCSECEGHHTIIEYREKYLCVVCFTLSDSLNVCEWCGEANNGDMEYSYIRGCSVCDGKAGWEKDD